MAAPGTCPYRRVEYGKIRVQNASEKVMTIASFILPETVMIDLKNMEISNNTGIVTEKIVIIWTNILLPGSGFEKRLYT